MGFLDNARGMRIIILAAIVMCSVASITGAKAFKEPAGLKVASVDGGRLVGEYTYAVQTDTELKKKDKDTLTRLRVWEQNYLLVEKDQAELGDLAVKDASGMITDVEKKRKETLTMQSSALLNEFETLRNKKVGEVTVTDQSRLTILQKSATDTQLRLSETQAKVKDDLQQQATKADAKVQKDVRDAISKVAKEKGVSLVLRGDFALYAESDLTDDVLKVLNKK